MRNLILKRCFFIQKSITDLMLSQLYFAGLQVHADWLVAMQLLGSSGKPCVQLLQRVLKLAQTQQSTL